MKILQIFGAVVAIHLAVFAAIFASPGCQSSPSAVPTPDATAPTVSEAPPPAAFTMSVATPTPVDLTTPSGGYTGVSSGHAAPTRPNSAAAVAVTPTTKPAVEVAPVSTYTVTRGDSLWSIAKKNHLTVSELAKANNLSNGATLQPGRKLIIPGKAHAAPAADAAAMTPAGTTTTASATTTAADKAAATPVPKGVESVKHTVQPGESLGVIARKYQVTVGDLARANNISNPSEVRAGQQLIIPGFKSVSSKKSPAKSDKPAVEKSATPATAQPATPPPPANPHFEIAAPPPGQDLDSGLKDSSATEVPTVKVEDSSAPKK